MQFIEYILENEHINKTICKGQCDFIGRDRIVTVGVPPPVYPNKILGVFISRDPTTAFEPFYEIARGVYSANQNIPSWRDLLITECAPPRLFINRITTFQWKYLGNKYLEEVKSLRKVMYNNVYWTHLHKCCTDEKIEVSKFNKQNATACGGMWLKEELMETIGPDTRFIIGVSGDVNKWVSMWKENDGKNKDISVFSFPHPSGAASGAWNPDGENRDMLSKKIVELLELCHNL